MNFILKSRSVIYTVKSTFVMLTFTLLNVTSF
jgi:hypothetical protein